MIRVRETAQGIPNREAAPEVTPARLGLEPGGGVAAPCTFLIFPASAIHARPGGYAVLASAASAALVNHLQLLDRLLPAADGPDLRFLVEATRTLLHTCLSHRPSEGVAADDLRAAERRADIEHCIRRNLGSARLNAARICALTGVSRSTLYRLFAESGGVASHIRTLRLEMVLADLADPAHEHESIAQIAARRGLYCAASFTRSFRKAFGLAPGDVRARALSRAKTFHDGRPPEPPTARGDSVGGGIHPPPREAETWRKGPAHRGKDPWIEAPFAGLLPSSCT